MDIQRNLRPPGAASYLGLSASTLAKMRLRGDGPPYSKAGPRIVVYDVQDLNAWLDARKRKSTSEAPPSEVTET
jgi:predicted DNA-binding transcriptional regulator AlpA